MQPLAQSYSEAQAKENKPEPCWRQAYAKIDDEPCCCNAFSFCTCCTRRCCARACCFITVPIVIVYLILFTWAWSVEAFGINPASVPLPIASYAWYLHPLPDPEPECEEKYPVVTTGTCQSHGYVDIRDVQECSSVLERCYYGVDDRYKVIWNTYFAIIPEEITATAPGCWPWSKKAFTGIFNGVLTPLSLPFSSVNVILGENGPYGDPMPSFCVAEYTAVNPVRQPFPTNTFADDISLFTNSLALSNWCSDIWPCYCKKTEDSALTNAQESAEASIQESVNGGSRNAQKSGSSSVLTD